jgi:hypothetical protein
MCMYMCICRLCFNWAQRSTMLEETETCMHKYMQYAHKNTRTYVHTYIHNTYIQACMHTYVHTYIRTYVHSYIYTYVHSCIHTYMCTCIHTYIHTYIHTQWADLSSLEPSRHTPASRYIHTYTHTYIYTYTVGRSEFIGTFETHAGQAAQYLQKGSAFV